MGASEPSESPRKTLVEICAESPGLAAAAERGGADRVELCTSLDVGGTTPSAGAIDTAREAVTIDLAVLVRPRGGDFVYDAVEFAAMSRDVLVAKEFGVDAIVTGCLAADHTIDVDRTRTLVELARPLEVCFHRAFDECPDPLAAAEVLVELGVDRVLTSGGAPSAFEGVGVLRELVERFGGELAILAGGSVRSHNVREIVSSTGVSQVHLRAGGEADVAALVGALDGER